MKYLFFALFLLTTPTIAFTQNEATVVTSKKLKVVFQLTTNDTLAQKALVKQIQNVLNAAPNSKIEVVCHNNGITFLQSAATQQAAKIKDLTTKGVDFVACENTMRDRKIKHEELISDCRTVPSGVVELIIKQDKGWAYLKAGF
jgi:uncharacterized protein